MSSTLTVSAFVVIALASNASRASEQFPVAEAMVGATVIYKVRAGDTLARIGARLGVSPELIANANGMPSNPKLKSGQQLAIDNRHIVPNVLGEGIVINVPQRMLFRMSGGEVRAAYPVGLGRRDWQTPVGQFRIVHLEENKTWVVPKSIQTEMRRQGLPMRSEVPPGPDNPLGKHWIGLSMGSLGIHATIAPMSVYHFQSHGCIRLHPDDAADLYDAVMPEDVGEIIYQPILMAKLPDGRIFLEVNNDIYRRVHDKKQVVMQLVAQQALGAMIDWVRANEVLDEAAGIARDISAAPVAQ